MYVSDGLILIYGHLYKILKTRQKASLIFRWMSPFPLIKLTAMPRWAVTWLQRPPPSMFSDPDFY